MHRYGIAAALVLGLVFVAHPVSAAPYHHVSAPAGQASLSVSDQGPAVSLLQADLSGLGYPVGPVDGLYGPSTQAGVSAFQQSSGLPPTGSAGTTTFHDIAVRGGWAASVPSTLTATAYGPSLQDNYPYGPTDYFGQPLHFGDVAVDPRVIPLGTRLYISGYHSPFLPPGGFVAVARDTGGAIKGDRIDIYFNGNRSQISSFGVQQVHISILP